MELREFSSTLHLVPPTVNLSPLWDTCVKIKEPAWIHGCSQIHMIQIFLAFI